MLEYPARAKVLAKTRMWDRREAAHCTRGIVGLSTARAALHGRARRVRLAFFWLWITAAQAY
jgi:hypothetical protein